MALVQWSAFPFDLRPAGVAPAYAFRSRWNDEGDALVLRSRLQGFRKRDLSVTLDGDVVELSAKRSVGWLDPIVSSYAERVTIPRVADPTTLTASFDRGDLVVRVAKLPSARSRRFAIHVAGEAPAQDLTPAGGTTPAGVWQRTCQRVRRTVATLRRRTGAAS